MHFTKIVLTVVSVVGYASALGIGHAAIGGGLGGGYGGIGGGYGGIGGGYGGAHDIGVPQPYKLQEQSRLEDGGAVFRSEVGDGSGSVSGSYGYRDQQGLYRQVDYLADAAGFRANVKTNEPGTDGKENPADVNMQVEQTPAGVVHRAQAEAARRAAARLHSGIGGGIGAHSGAINFYGGSTHGGAVIGGPAGHGGAFGAFGSSAGAKPKSSY